MTFFKKHTLLLIYHLVFSILLLGVFTKSGTTYLFFMGCFYISLITSYIIFSYTIRSKEIEINSNINTSKIPLFALLTCVSIIVIHFIYLNDLPLVRAIFFNQKIDIINLRQNISLNSNPLINYLVSFNIKSFIPLTLLYLHIKNKNKFYWILYVLSVFYAFNMMHKSYIVIIHGPIILYCLMQKRFIYILKYALVTSFVILSLTHKLNQDIGKKNYYKYENVEKKSLSIGLLKRVLVVPGATVSGWFENVPKNLPFLHGKGYGFLCKLRGEKHVKYSKDLYPFINPNYSKKGLKGNVNVASFMYDYVNFGLLGLVLSGILLGIIFTYLEKLFKNDFNMKLVVNLIPILILSSQALTTLLFSGGWALSVILYFYFIKPTTSNC